MAAPLDRRQLLQLGALAALPWAAARAQETEIRLPSKVRLGLIGPASRTHYREATNAARDYEEIELVAVGALDDEQARNAENIPELAGARKYRDYRKMLDAENLDAVCICDETGTRAETTIACLERGIPVASEKPSATSLEQLAEVERIAASTGTPLTTLLFMRYEPSFVAMKEIVTSGVIGEPVLLSGQKSYRLGQRPAWMQNRDSYGGTIPFIGCHVIDLLYFVSGRDMTHAAAFHANVGAPHVGDMENTCAVSLRLDNGGTADMRLDYLRPEAAPSHGDDRIRVAGTNGVVEYRDGKVFLIDGHGPREVVEFPKTRTLLPDFLDAVFNDGAPMLTADEVFRVSRIVLTAREAADQQRVLEI